MSDGGQRRLPGFIAESEVLPPSKNLGLRLLGLLVALGLLIGIVLVGGAAVFTMIWPERAGMCDASAGSCDDLTIAQIGSFSGIDVPETATIEQAQYGRVDSTEWLFANILLAEGDADPLRVGDYRVAAFLPWAAAVDVLMLDNVVLYESFDPDVEPGSGAASGQREDGRTVLLIRVTREI